MEKKHLKNIKKMSKKSKKKKLGKRVKIHAAEVINELLTFHEFGSDNSDRHQITHRKKINHLDLAMKCIAKQE